MHFGGFWYVLENLRTSENISLRSVNIATKFEREREREREISSLLLKHIYLKNSDKS